MGKEERQDMKQEWHSDIDATTAYGHLKCKPINIVRSPLDCAKALFAGDVLNVQIVEQGNVEAKTPQFKIAESFVATHVVKFEVMDELGFDVGIGFVIGGHKPKK